MDDVLLYVTNIMKANGFTLQHQDRRRLKKSEAVELYDGIRKKWYHSIPIQFIINGECVIMVWYHPDDAIALAKKLVGPTYAVESMQQDCMRGHLLRTYGQSQPPFENAANFIHVPGGADEHRQQMTAVFGQVLPDKRWAS